MYRRIFLTILQNISFLAKQDMALRGGNGNLESNFTQLLVLRGIDNPEIVPWMQKKTNKYTKCRMSAYRLWHFVLFVI